MVMMPMTVAMAIFLILACSLPSEVVMTVAMAVVLQLGGFIDDSSLGGENSSCDRGDVEGAGTDTGPRSLNPPDGPVWRVAESLCCRML
jgi:hypothetical protein